MLRELLLLVLALVIARAIWRVVEGVMQGVSGQHSQQGRSGKGPARSVQMVRDPVCGTYVIPDRAIVLADGSGQVFFCSASCAEKYRARPSTRSGRPEPVEGRTA